MKTRNCCYFLAVTLFCNFVPSFSHFFTPITLTLRSPVRMYEHIG